MYVGLWTESETRSFVLVLKKTDTEYVVTSEWWIIVLRIVFYLVTYRRTYLFSYFITFFDPFESTVSKRAPVGVVFIGSEFVRGKPLSGTISLRMYLLT